MYYLSLMEKVKEGYTPKVTYVEGGQTDGHLKFEEPKPKAKKKVELCGFQYAENARIKEKMDELRVEEDRKRVPLMCQVEDLTSIGTLPNIHEIQSDSMTQVYSQYNFKHKPDQRLLIHDYKDDILANIASHQVSLIKGATGCGKTTQVPQFILDEHESQNLHCNIIVTQPRRIAAVSVASRVCRERQWPLGSVVGYQIGLERNTSPDTRLNYVTTGVLLQILVKKQSLSDYTHIVLDEIHERDNESDFLLIIIKKLLKDPLCRTKVILMSATLNSEPFVKYFSRTVKGTVINPPVIEMSYQHKYEVNTFYLDSLRGKLPKVPDVKITEPTISKLGYELARDMINVFSRIDDKEGDNIDYLKSVLVFLPGIAEIEKMHETLSMEPPQCGEKWHLCPLHSSVTHEEQQEVFLPAPPGHRKIILATNIAESSITVTDVKYILDFCIGKQQVIDPDTGYSALEYTYISKSQAIQRAGRVGRVMPGRVYRLVPKDLFQMLPDELTPEITRCPLDQLVLKAKQLNMGAPKEILGLAIDPPDLSNIHKTVLNLKEMGALLLTVDGTYEDDDGDLTYVGEIMSALPLDTQLSKVIVLGYIFSVLPDAVIMACAMSMKSIFRTPFNRQLEAYNSKLSWAHSSSSDPIAYLSAYKLWRHKVKTGQFMRSGGLSEENWCRNYYIQTKTIREVARLEKEVESRLKNIGIETISNESQVKWDEVEKSLILKIILAGAFYPNYFAPTDTDEKEAVKILGGRDPYNTVYLTGMPKDQPGPLYVHAIKKHFAFCGSKIGVYFDSSSKTYLSFGSSIPEAKTLEANSSEKASVPGAIGLSIYRAIKLRQLGIHVEIPVLLPSEAKLRAEQLLGSKVLRPSLFERNSLFTRKSSNLPTIGNNTLFVSITQIDSPSKFYVTLNDEGTSRKNYWIFTSLNSVDLPPYQGPLNTGAMVIAPYAETVHSRMHYYRALINSVKKNHDQTFALVYFLDYGNEEAVDVRKLKDFLPEMTDVKEEPPLALRASLAEIRPAQDKNEKGEWTQEARTAFQKYFPNLTAIAKVYSAVNNIMSLTLFDQQHPDLPYERSFNYELINRGLAEPADEPYLSREDHMNRLAAEMCPESLSSFSSPDNYLTSCFQPAVEDFEPVKESECRSRVKLNGPKSPLEQNLYAFPKKCQGKEIVIEWNSVNSVLLNNYPTDPHTRLVVAATVTQSTSNRLTLRNTTIMPNLHGLSSIICLLFSPKIELRCDKDKQNFTGALCGLGYDEETGAAYFPENDIEITFDTLFTLSDLETINRLRFWMDFILADINHHHGEVIDAQRKIKEIILSLLHKRLPSKIPVGYPRPFEWNELDKDDLVVPLISTETKIFQLINGISLASEDKASSALLAQAQLLEKYSSGSQLMRPGGTHCALCQVHITSLTELKLHLATHRHRINVADLQEIIKKNETKRT